MLKKIWLVCLILFVFGILVSAQEDKTEEISPAEQSEVPPIGGGELKAKIEKLIKDLGAEDWSTREAATKALEEIGAPAESFLKKAQESPDAEVRFRAKGFLSRLEIKKQGKIAYIRGKDPWIWIMNVNGENETKLARGGNPVWSPDGSKIAFVSFVNDHLGIYVMDAAGKNQRKLTSNNNNNYRPIWSPDGLKIIFASQKSSKCIIHSMDINGANLLSLTPEMDLANGLDFLQISCSSASKKIVFSLSSFNKKSSRIENQIYIMDIDGTNLIRLTAKGTNRQAVWSPDGQRIAFVSTRNHNSEVYLMDATGGNQIRLTNTKFDEDSPCWSPDGTKIAYEVTYGFNIGDRCDIYVMNADGKNQMRLTFNNINSSPGWSPDSKKTVFISDRDGNWGIHTVGIETKIETKLTTGEAPTWQPVPKK